MASFSASEDAVRILAIFSPNCRDCLEGYGLVMRLFTRFSSTKLQGYIIWNPTSDRDEESKAKAESECSDDARLRYFWDDTRIAGGLIGKMLGLQDGIAAEDVYLLYSPRMKWENEDNPPDPAFWMHQMTPAQGANRDLRLDYDRFREETKFFLEAEDPDLVDKGITEVLLSNEKKES